ncbi:Dynein, 78 kDa intermediate chain, flagellar outer arm-like 4, partial [Homarus americanus]
LENTDRPAPQHLLHRKRREEHHLRRLRETPRCFNLATTTLLAPEPTEAPSKVSLNLPGLRQAAVILERMINQNIYDDIVQDFMYWEDGGDDYHPLHGSLLPLWKFASDTSRPFVVSDICWSPVYRDLFAAAYTNGEAGVGEGAGMLCLYTLKNPTTPERIFHAHSGVTCVHLHP